MKINMHITHDLFSNCAQDVFLNILTHYNLDIKKLLSTGWNFIYDNSNPNVFFGNRLDIYHGDLYDLKECLKRHYGIYLEYKVVRNYKEAVEVISRNIEAQSPVCLYMDSFNCSWQPGYKIYHNKHMLIVLGVCEFGLICADPYLNKPEVILTPEEFEAEIGELIEIKFCDYSEYDDKTIITSVARNILNQGDNGSVCSLIQCFSNDLMNQKELLDTELNQYELAFIPIIRKLNYLCYGRMSFLQFFKFASEKEKANTFNTDVLVSEFELIAKRWSIVANKLMKYKLTGCSDLALNDICEKLNVLSIQEETLAKTIIYSI